MIKKTIFSIILIQIALVFIQFGLTLGRATDGDKIYELQSEITQMQKHNSRLSEDIYRQTTITRIKDYANSLGFVPQTIANFDPAPVAARWDTP